MRLLLIFTRAPFDSRQRLKPRLSDSDSVCHVGVTFSLFCVALNVRSFTSVTAGSGESIFVIARAAAFWETTRFDVDALLFAAMLSVVVVVIVDVMLSVVPIAVPALTWTMGENVALAPAASDAIVHVIVPPEPTAGIPQVHPTGTVSDWKF